MLEDGLPQRRSDAEGKKKVKDMSHTEYLKQKEKMRIAVNAPLEKNDYIVPSQRQTPETMLNRHRNKEYMQCLRKKTKRTQ